MDKKTCPRCERARPPDEFYKNKAQPDGLAIYCRECEKAYLQERRRRDASGEKKRSAKYRLKCVFNMTMDEYDRLEELQGGGCAVCGRPPTEQRLHVDHCAETGLIRGLLCYDCNRNIIGRVTRPEVFTNAEKYLRYPPARAVLGDRKANR